MRRIPMPVSLLVLSLMAPGANAQIVGAPVDLPIALRENLTPTSFFALGAVEGPGSEIGVTVRGLPADETTALPKMSHGVVVESVAKDSPAFHAGLKTGDVIYFYTYGPNIDEVRAFKRLVRETPPGRMLPVSVFRNGAQTGIGLVPELARAGSEQP